MNGRSRRVQARSVFLAAIMVLSMIAIGGAGLAGSAAADEEPGDAEAILLDGDTHVDTFDGDTAIQDAINAISDEDDPRIEVGSGIYQESVEIDVEGLTLEAAEDAQPTIEGNIFIGTEGDGGSNPTSADGTVIDGFEIVDPNPGSTDRGIGVTESANVVIQNNEFEGFRTQITMDFAGDDVEDITIQNNTFADVNEGDAEEGTAVGSTENVDGLDILNNEFINNRNDIGTDDSTKNVTIEDNDFEAGDSNFYVTVRADGLDAQTVIDNNSFNPDAVVNSEVLAEGNELIAVEGGDLATVLNTDQRTGFTEIQTAVNDAEPGDTIEVGSGTYNEEVVVDVPDLTLATDGGEETLIEGTIDVAAEGVEVTNLAVSPDEFTEDDAAILVTAGETTVSQVTVEGVRGDGSGTIHGIQVWHDGGDDDRIDNVQIVDNTVQDIENAGSGASAIKIQGAINNSFVAEHNISDIHSAGWAYGVVTTPSASSGGDVTVTRVGIGFNEIDGITANEYEGVAIGLDTGPGGVGDEPKTDAREVEIIYNTIGDADIGVLNKDTENTAFAVLNYWGSADGPEAGDIGGDVEYDPFLTARHDEVEHPDEDSLPTRQFATDLVLDEGANAIAFPAPSERTLEESLETEHVSAVYTYDNVADEWELVHNADESAGDLTPSALDVYIVVVEDGEEARAVIEFDNTETDEIELGETEVDAGWNLVSPTRVAHSEDEAFQTSNAEVQFTVSPSGYSPEGQPFHLDDGDDYSPYEGYWAFVDDDDGDSLIASPSYDGLTLGDFIDNVIDWDN